MDNTGLIREVWKAEWGPAREVVVGSVGMWALDFRASRDLRVGDVVRFVPDFLKATWKQGEFFFTTAADCAIEHRRVFPNITNRGVTFDAVIEGEITAGTIAEGEPVRLCLGNYSQCGRDWQAPTLAVRDAKMRLMFRSAGSDSFQTVSEIIVDFVPAKTAGLAVGVTSPTKNPNSICVSSLDQFANMTSDIEETVNILSVQPSGVSKLPARVPLKNGKALLSEQEMPEVDAPSFLYAQMEGSEAICSGKLPYHVGFTEDIGRDIYFGETHLHCEGSRDDGMNSPEFVYEYAKRAAGMAFCAITDHVGKITDDFWRHQCAVARDYYEPGVFVPILGYEWDSDWMKGHTGVFVKEEIDEVVDASSIGELREKLNEVGCEFFTRPNHLNTVAEHLPFLPLENLQAWRQYDWSQHDDRSQPLVEIVTPRGSSEKEEPGDGVLHEGFGASAASALEHGCHIGFTGGSDDHTGRPGRTPEEMWRAPKKSLHSGITAVLSEKLDRESLWDALVNRQTYATTGAHILLDFRVGGLIVGQRLVVADQREAAVSIRAVGTEEISNVTIIRNGKVLREFKPQSLVCEETFVDKRMDFSNMCMDGHAGHTFYYARVTQKDGHRAWSSPIYFCLSAA